MSVAVVVPFRGGCPYRERAWEWVRTRYAQRHPDWEVIEAPAPDGPWCKGAAAVPVVEATTADVVVVADADVWTDGVPGAVAAVQGGAGWAIPHSFVHRLTEAATAAVLAGADWRGQPLADDPYRGLPGGGLVVARRDVWLKAPIDRRFKSWGQEDECQAMALGTLVGEPWRGGPDLVHLWHPPQERLTRRRGSPESVQLRSRYYNAKDHPVAMTALIKESYGAD